MAKTSGLELPHFYIENLPNSAKPDGKLQSFGEEKDKILAKRRTHL